MDYLGNLVDGPARPLPANTVVRFGPEFKQYYTEKTLDFHPNGRCRHRRLVYASTYWAQDDSLGQRVFGIHAVPESVRESPGYVFQLPARSRHTPA